MNLYFRLVIVFLKAWFAKRKGWSEESRLLFRVRPLDCDAYLHLTGSRYLSIADIGRIHLLGQMGLFRPLLKRRWVPIMGAAEASYLRPIKAFRKYQLRTRMLTWDEKYWYAEHRFEVRGELHAVLLARGVFVRGRAIVPMREIMALIGEDASPPPAPETVQQWRRLLKTKGDTYAASGHESNRSIGSGPVV